MMAGSWAWALCQVWSGGSSTYHLAAGTLPLVPVSKCFDKNLGARVSDPQLALCAFSLLPLVILSSKAPHLRASVSLYPVRRWGGVTGWAGSVAEVGGEPGAALPPPARTELCGWLAGACFASLSQSPLGARLYPRCFLVLWGGEGGDHLLQTW